MMFSKPLAKEFVIREITFFLAVEASPDIALNDTNRLKAKIGIRILFTKIFSVDTDYKSYIKNYYGRVFSIGFCLGYSCNNAYN